jgi:hypothetical protein
LFFSLLKECLESGQITRTEIEREMRNNHVRHDAFAVMNRVPPLDAILNGVKAAA